jgi:hypothetical protein
MPRQRPACSSKKLSPDMDCLLQKLWCQMKKERIVDLWMDDEGHLELSVTKLEVVNTKLP